MKTLLCFLLILALSFSQTVPTGGWKDQDPDDVNKSPFLKQYLDAGVSQFIQQAMKANEISTPDMSVKIVYSISTQVVNGFTVKFNLELVENDGKLHHGVDLVVYSAPGASTKKLISYKLNYSSRY